MNCCQGSIRSTGCAWVRLCSNTKQAAFNASLTPFLLGLEGHHGAPAPKMTSARRLLDISLPKWKDKVVIKMKSP